jgi:hypothetical protein
MSRLRFATAQALFDTFPSSVTRIAARPTGDSPIEYVKKLVAQEKVEDAVAFCAYLLPRRETVWWACGCARMLLGEIPEGKSLGLLVAEDWVREPDEMHRQAALAIGTQGDRNNPMTWLALSAGWAGGFLVNNQHKQISMPQYMTPRAARIAVILSSIDLRPLERGTRLNSCIAQGIKLAESGL